MQKTFNIGVDIGSTTVKLVASQDGKVLYQTYQRHNSEARATLAKIIGELDAAGVITCSDKASIIITGSGGIRVADILGAEFVQEVIACTKAISALIPETDVAIELGGEDSKITYLSGGLEQRMNNSCAGGTGAFIDQMAILLKTDATGLNEMAAKATNIYPIAARCGVFAKTDVQQLLNDGISPEEIAISIFQATTNQVISALAQGRKIKGKIAFLGGPLTYISELKKRFIKTLEIAPNDVVVAEDAQLFVAKGAALYAGESAQFLEWKEWLGRFETLKGDTTKESKCLLPLFANEKQLDEFRKRHNSVTAKRGDIAKYKGVAFLGLDCGSTTTKAALIGTDGELLYSYYGSNEGDPLSIVAKILREVYAALPKTAHIGGTSVTGYGEMLIKSAYKADHGEVETMAHYRAARHFNPQVSAIIDIGGQDMKYIRIKNNSIDSIVLNEACSSGCGSFIETFAKSLKVSVQEFAAAALKAKYPVDLGSRCTVFMNSSIKQAQKEGTSVSDISAGLSFSVIKNALIKVIKLKAPSDLGESVVVQGGTFYNEAVLRAFEMVSGREVIRPEIAGLMGAFGCALGAKSKWKEGEKSTLITLGELDEFKSEKIFTRCGICTNNCQLTIHNFSGGRRFISGNRCERPLGLQATDGKKPENLYLWKYQRLFDYKPMAGKLGKIGIPRALGFYENYPLWHALLTSLGYEVVLSGNSTKALADKGFDSIASDSVCYPAKLVHGHIADLIEKGVSAIFYPCVVFERKEFKDSFNNYNCPVVATYPESVKANMDLGEVKFIQPFVSVETEKTLLAGLKGVFPVSARTLKKAVRLGFMEQEKFRKDVALKGEEVLDQLRKNGGKGIVLCGRPYHIDPEVNHGISQVINSLGMAVLTEDSIAHLCDEVGTLRAVDQWSYHTRAYRAANVVANNAPLEIVQLNSFGCGLDSVITDQTQEIIERAGKIYTCLKIDDISNLGAAKIRLRSLKAVMEDDTRKQNKTGDKYPKRAFTEKMKGYTILAPQMSPIHFQFLEPAFKAAGYNLKILEKTDRDTVDQGLRFVNNDACYPSIVVVGQILEALQSGEYDLGQTAVAITQTGGGCRATNYIAYLRKALADAGFGQIPVISVNAMGVEKQPGFKITFGLLKRVLMGFIYGDILLSCTLRQRPYEAVAGTTDTIYRKWVEVCKAGVLDGSIREFRRNLPLIIDEFEGIAITSVKKPRVGLVGEILVKFHDEANNQIVKILEKEGAEAVQTGIMNFFLYCIMDDQFRAEKLGAPRRGRWLSKVIIRFIEWLRRPAIKRFAKSRRFYAMHDIYTLAEIAKPVLSLGNQSGEGWLLTAEMLAYIEEGADNIVCMQPFGCLPNHIVGRGMANKIKRLHPDANIVALDYDPGASSTNQENRIKLMMAVAKGKM